MAEDMIGWDHHTELLHIYAQPFCHDEAFIVGNVTGLTRLRDAIQRVLDNRGADAAEVMTTDGEGYSAIVVYAEREQTEHLALPYTEEGWGDQGETALWPANIPAVKRWYAAERAKRAQGEQPVRSDMREKD